MKHAFIARIAATFLIVLAARAQKLNPVSPAPLNQAVQFDVFLPLENSSQLDQLISNLNTPGSANYHQWLTPQQFRSQFGASPQTQSQVSKALAAYGLTLTAAHTSGLHFQGPVAA